MSGLQNPPARRSRPNRPTTPAGRNGWLPPWGKVIPADWPAGPDGLPTLFEDEGQDDMGENRQHNDSTDILFYGVRAHLAGRPGLEVFCNLNFYYRPKPDDSYVSPDVMVVRPPRPLPQDLPSYQLGEDGPAPVLTAEVLSLRSFQQQDLSNKIVLYHRLGVAEYLLIDVPGRMLPDRLLLKRRTRSGWYDLRDDDGGITSDFGFRVVIDADDRPRVLDATTGHRYPRPDEADRRIRELEAELARLKGTPPSPRRRGKKK